MGELAEKIRAKYPGAYDSLSDGDLESKVTAKYPGVYDHLAGTKVVSQSKDYNASPAKTERMRREFISLQGDADTRRREFYRSSFDPTQPTAPADSVTDFIGRVLPESATKLIPRIAHAGYEAIKGQTDPIVNSLSSLQPTGLPGRQMEANAGNTLAGLAQTVTAPTGLMGLDAAKNAWTTDPVGSALAVAPVVKVAGGLKPVPKTTAALDATISKQYQQAVRPTVSGTAGSYRQFTQSNKRSVEGVYDIVRAKDRGELKIGDEMAGQEVTNRLPETMQEHLQAISQQKGNTFAKYDAMKREAGENGASVDLNPIAAELSKASNDPVLNDLRPGTAQYMKQQAEVLTKRNSYTAEQAQQAIATLNKDVESFYRNPSPDMAGKIVVDASVVKHLRTALDAAIEQEAGPGYQALKNEYGRLASMEKDAGHRARVAGRAAPASLIDAIGGYLGSGEIVSGVLSMNPALIAKGGTMLALKNYIKRINSPDFKVKQMYKTADKNYTRPVEEPRTPIERNPPAASAVTEPPVVSPPVAEPPAKPMSFTEFTKGKMGPYMKSEGGHGAAMKRLSAEWKEYKAPK